MAEGYAENYHGTAKIEFPEIGVRCGRGVRFESVDHGAYNEDKAKTVTFSGPCIEQALEQALGEQNGKGRQLTVTVDKDAKNLLTLTLYEVRMYDVSKNPVYGLPFEGLNPCEGSYKCPNDLHCAHDPFRVGGYKCIPPTKNFSHLKHLDGSQRWNLQLREIELLRREREEIAKKVETKKRRFRFF
jgi:hypothetical protein